ncbi:MAG: OmpA family protein [Candidatus Edwardsbacteria bacterium]|jgi:chemotaxis protein MotB|nr:OmpA family protein [Candidatus Edwardsbacteria bacterium]
MKNLLIALGVVALALACAAVYFWYDGARAKREAAGLRNTVSDLSYMVAALEGQKADMSRELEAKVADISRAKEEEVTRAKATYDELAAGMKAEIEQGQVTITQLADRLSVSMVDKILFPSGEAQISPAGLKVLERVGNVLKNTRNKIIRVEGHTDDVPIHPNLQKQFPTNWELSAARATNVVRFLHDQAGIAPQRLQAIGMAEYRPVASNKTPAGRGQNRRIEIALVPEPVVGK